MNRSVSKSMFVLFAALILALQSQIVGATTVYVEGDIYTGRWRYYASQRTVSYAPYEVAMEKRDGPGMWAYMYGCGPSAGAGDGPVVYFEDPDPPYSWQWLRSGKSWGITFCLAAKSNGADSSDVFYARLDWDG